MKKAIIILLYILTPLVSVLSQNGYSLLSKDQLLHELIDEYGVVGASAGYTINGKTIWSSSIGYANREDKSPFTDTLLTRIASISKCMTAVAIMQLFEKGLIDLDAPIQTYIPDFPIQKKGIISTSHLLSHMSGIGSYKNSKEAETQTEYSNLREAVAVFENRKLDFTPGTDFGYSTYGYVVLGLIIEKISGISFEEYLQEHIWNKAGMSNTGIEKYGIDYPNKSALYHYERKKTVDGTKNNLSNRVPGGGVYSTLQDILKFGNGILNNIFISAKTSEFMTQIHTPDKVGNPYGYGWFLYGQSPNEHLAIGHGGEQTGCSSQIMINIKSNVVVAILGNTSGIGNQTIIKTARLLEMANAVK
jgi:serine beta-lactamase-like protein LACTB, mitochondrial